MSATHDVRLRGPRFCDSERPFVLQHVESDFLPRTLAALRTEEGRRALRTQVPSREDGAIRLYRPSHRTFHLVLVAAECIVPGLPRVDPRKIESAGLVVRRVRGRTVQAWRVAPDLTGWVDLDAAHIDVDPDPERAGSHASDAGAEQVTKLFAPPPDTCRAAGATVYYGLLPLGGAETASAPRTATFTAEEAREVLPSLLRAGMRPAIPSAGGVLHVADAARRDATFRAYRAALEQLLVQFDLRGTSPDASRLRALLGDLVLEYPDREHGSALAHVERAIDVLVMRSDATGTGLRMPLRWPEIGREQEHELTQLFRSALDARIASLAPRAGRYDDASARYEIRAFVRVRRDGGCPPVLVWSAPTEPVSIAPWHANGPAPPLLVQLPDVSLESIRAMRPNVSFALPPSLHNLLQANDPKALLDGDGAPPPQSPLIAWICSFNIPLITICAFLMLNIFLQLFNIVFGWLAFIRVCIPMPASLKQRS